MSQNQTDFILAALADLRTDVKEGLSGVHQRLDTLNGRTRAVENSVGIQWTLWIIVGMGIAALLPVAVEAFWR